MHFLEAGKKKLKLQIYFSKTNRTSQIRLYRKETFLTCISLNIHHIGIFNAY